MSETGGAPAAEIPDSLMLYFEPIEWQKGKYDSISLREPKAGEVRKAEGQMRSAVNPETARLYQMHLIANVSGLPFLVVEQLPIRTINEAVAYLQAFINAGPETGSTS